MPSIFIHAANMTTERLLLPMVEATTTAIPISKTTTAIITNLSGSHGQKQRPTIIIYPTGKWYAYFISKSKPLTPYIQYIQYIHTIAIPLQRLHINGSCCHTFFFYHIKCIVRITILHLLNASVVRSRCKVNRYSRVAARLAILRILIIKPVRRTRAQYMPSIKT